MSRRTALLALCVFGPVALIAVWIGSYAFKAATGQTVELRIRGADPRDLLSGHYLRYRVDYGAPVSCGNEREWCLCLGVGDGGIATLESQGPCREQSCDLVLRGRCDNGGFDAGLDRFYFSEDFQKELAVVPTDSTIRVRLSSSGDALVEELRVAGEPLADWLARQE